MKKTAAILSLLLISFTAQAKFIQNLGEPGMFPHEDKKLETLQLILLKSADRAFVDTRAITLDTSLMQMKRDWEIDSRSIDALLLEAEVLVKTEGCSLSIESEMGQRTFAKINYDGRGNIITIGDLLPILNAQINCP